MNNKSRFLVSADWLQDHLGEERLSVVDGAWYLPAANRDAKKEYEQCHIPHAVFFDHDEICDQTSGLPHTLPTPEAFAQQMGKLGINADDTIVVYDGPGFFSAPRVWWMLRVMGAKNVFVLDGGFDRWREEKRPTTKDVTPIEPTVFVTKFQPDRVVFFDEMRDIVDNGSMQIADARGNQRFSGQGSEPRPGMRAGHMPGAHNVPYASLSVDGKFKDFNELKEVFHNAGIDVNAPVVTTCGSGVTAAVLALALESLGNNNIRLYDGSWSEWGSKNDTPVVTGDEQKKR